MAAALPTVAAADPWPTNIALLEREWSDIRGELLMISGQLDAALAEISRKLRLAS